MTRCQTDPKQLSYSRELRYNQTSAESKLWEALRANRLNGVHFRRQHVIGQTIVDFCALRCKLVIEVDGDQHLEQQDYDMERSAFLTSKGYRVLRFWNDEVYDHFEEVIQKILFALNDGDSHPR